VRDEHRATKSHVIAIVQYAVHLGGPILKCRTVSVLKISLAVRFDQRRARSGDDINLTPGAVAQSDCLVHHRARLRSIALFRVLPA
jgi:hypothetical protein